jgi:Uma2 family endonuclease
MVEALNTIVSHDDYLHAEQSSESKHEYLAGEIWAMVGASDAHVTIALNLAAILKQHLKGSPCRSYISDMKLRVEQADAYFYPDVMVSCDPRDLENKLIKQHPSFIAEVLSPSTEAFDRGQKFTCYRQLPSLQCYWLIDTGKQLIDSFVRTDNDDWLLHSYSQADEPVQIQTLDFTCSLEQIYDDLLTESIEQ